MRAAAVAFVCCLIKTWALPETVSSVSAPRLSDWMGDLEPLIGNLTIHDISVITTHNSASSILTATFSDNCEGATAEESALAHDASILPNPLNPEGRFAQVPWHHLAVALLG